MKFNTTHVWREKRFSIGVEEESGKPFVAIPVSNPYVDYEEFYEIDENIFQAAPDDIAELERIVKLCRERKYDSRIFLKPGRLRGDPQLPAE